MKKFLGAVVTALVLASGMVAVSAGPAAATAYCNLATEVNYGMITVGPLGTPQSMVPAVLGSCSGTPDLVGSTATTKTYEWRVDYVKADGRRVVAVRVTFDYTRLTRPAIAKSEVYAA